MLIWRHGSHVSLGVAVLMKGDVTRGEVLNLLEKEGAHPWLMIHQPAPVEASATRRHATAERVSGSMRTRKSFSELIEGRLSCADGRGELDCEVCLHRFNDDIDGYCPAFAVAARRSSSKSWGDCRPGIPDLEEFSVLC